MSFFSRDTSIDAWRENPEGSATHDSRARPSRTSRARREKERPGPIPLVIFTVDCSRHSQLYTHDTHSLSIFSNSELERSVPVHSRLQRSEKIERLWTVYFHGHSIQNSEASWQALFLSLFIFTAPDTNSETVVQLLIDLNDVWGDSARKEYLFRLEVYKRVGISRVGVYKRVGISRVGV